MKCMCDLKEHELKPASPLSPFCKEIFQKSFLELQLPPSPLGLDLSPGSTTYSPNGLGLVIQPSRTCFLICKLGMRSPPSLGYYGDQMLNL